VVSSRPRLHFTPGKDQVPILEEAAWAPELVWTGEKSRPQRESIPELPVRSSVAIPTELPDPRQRHIQIDINNITNLRKELVMECSFSLTNLRGRLH